MVETVENSGDKELSPAQQYMLYGDVLDMLTFAEFVHDDVQPIFHCQLQGDYLRTPSFYDLYARAEEGTSRYPYGSVPIIAAIADAVHAELRKGTSKLPKLDKTTLTSETQQLMEAFERLIAEHQKAVRANADYIIPPSRHNEMKTLIEALEKSQLANATTIPVLLDGGEMPPTIVENREELGLYLFALSVVPRVLKDYNRIPVTLSEFIQNYTATGTAVTERQVKKLYDHAGTPGLQQVVETNFMATNARIKTIFDKPENQTALQLATIVATSWTQEVYQEILQALVLPVVPTGIHTNLEAAVLLESLAITSDNKTLAAIASAYAVLPNDAAPSARLLRRAQLALANVSAPSDGFAEDKIRLLNEYTIRQQKMMPTAGDWLRATSQRMNNSGVHDIT